MPTISPILVKLAALLAIAGMAGVAQAQVGLGDLASGSCTNTEPNGFPGVVDAPGFIVNKNYDVFSPGDPNNPAPLAGNNTYMYVLTYVGSSCFSSLPAPGHSLPIGLPVVRFEIIMDTSQATGAGSIAASPGVAPFLTSIDPAGVRWELQNPGNPADPLFPGLTFTCPAGPGTFSKQIYIQSPLLPGLVSETAVSVDGALSLDAPGTCVGPFVEPQEEGEPMPCTIGFWKNRTAGKKGLLKFFPATDFDPDLLAAAATLSNGIFADGNAVAAAVSAQGNIGAQAKAERQLAALLLNLAAGDLYPNNQKCKLFDGNLISANACGSNITVSQALNDPVNGLFAQYAAGNYGFVNDCADDINNGIGLEVEPSS